MILSTELLQFVGTGELAPPNHPSIFCINGFQRQYSETRLQLFSKSKHSIHTFGHIFVLEEFSVELHNMET